ncbi:MAG: glycosyl transferase [Deltaproteobacteria bacterium]|jgi:predicted glycosyltransferase|nr:glycosyl transferase [Deltaproteobacteria bacterium]
MKIAVYCQHVLGIGHLFRAIEICKALAGHDVILITGGPRIEKTLPDHIREFRLPALQMDHEFKGLYGTDPHVTLERLKERRQSLLLSFFKEETPDIFIVELYPFGRKAFRYELDPVLEAIRTGSVPDCGVICSVRDILVEKEDQEKHELRAATTLNEYFNAVLVHADPNLVELGETFFHLDAIAIPIIYTGYIAPKPEAEGRHSLRDRLGISPDDILIVASAGGGSVGKPLLESVVRAFKLLEIKNTKQLIVFAGPFLDEASYLELQQLGGDGISIEKFAPDFMSYLAAADLSVSMGGYNTSMNILAANVPALIWPFTENQEQRMRAASLAGKAAVRVLEDQDLEPHRLTGIMEQMILQRIPDAAGIDLDGAENTARWIETWAGCHNESMD